MRKHPDQQAGAPRKLTTEQREAPLSDEEIRALVAEAACERARKRGFAPAHEFEDWIEAEAEVMTRLGLWD